MNEGMFGLPIKPPGALYWFNISLLLMFMSSFLALKSGSFPGIFVIISLGVMSVLSMRYPRVSAQYVISTPLGFLVYALSVLAMCNSLDHLFHKPVSFSGLMSVILSGIVGFYLGRYASIGRFCVEEPPATQTDPTPVQLDAE